MSNEKILLEEMQTDLSISPKSSKSKKIKFTTAYIETFIHTVGGLTLDEISKAAQMSNQPKYFESDHVSEFCRRAREITRSFIPQLSHEKLFSRDILRYRRDEVAVLQYFCVEAARLGDDTRLMDFIRTMIENTKEAIFWTDYNALKNNFKILLDLQQQGKIRACYITDSEKKDIVKFQKIAEKIKNPQKAVDLEVHTWEKKHPSPQEFIKISVTYLKDNPSFEHLDLSHAGLQDKHIIDLISGLNLYPRLKTLKLANNHFGESGLITLTSTLTQQSALTLLDLSQNPQLGGVDANHLDTLLSIFLTHPTLTHLNLSKINLNNSDIRKLPENITLKSIQLWENSPDILKCISELNIEQTKKNVSTFIVKPPFVFLKGEIEAIGKIRENHIDNAYKVLLVDFSKQYPHTKGEDFVRQCMQKGYFSILLDPQIGIRNQLKKHLSALQLEFIYYAAYLHDKHTENQAIGVYLKSLHELLGEPIEMKEKLVVLWEGLSQGLAEGKIIGDRLILSHCFLDETALQSGLERMALQKKPFDRLQQLQHLDLSNNQISASGISALLEWLKNIPGLTYLDLSGNPLGEYPSPLPSGAKRLAEALPTLSKLQTLLLAKCGLCLSHIKLLSEAIKQHTALTHLNLNENALNDDSAAILAELLEGSPNATLSNAEINSPPTTTAAPLSMLTNTYTNADTTAEPNSLNRNSLQKLHLEKNAITDSGAIKLLNALDKNKSLKQLNLAGNSTISEDVHGPIRYRLHKNSGIVSNDPEPTLSEDEVHQRNDEIAATQTRLLLWQPVCQAWDRFAEAISDEDKEHRAAIPNYQKLYEDAAAKLIQQFKPPAVRFHWSETVPHSAETGSYFLFKIKEKDKTVWQVLKAKNNQFEKIEINQVERLQSSLSSLLHIGVNDVSDAKKEEVEHCIRRYHGSNLPNNLYKFYEKLHNDLYTLFANLKLLGTGITESNVKKSHGLFGELMGGSGGAVEGVGGVAHLPGTVVTVAGTVFGFIGRLLVMLDKFQQSNDLQKFANIGTENDFKQLAKQLALHLTMTYQSQILALSSRVPANTPEPNEETTSDIANELLRLYPKSPLEKLEKFMITKLGIRCIAGEFVTNIYQKFTFADAVERLSGLVITRHNCFVEKAKQEVMELIGAQKVKTEKTVYYPAGKEWTLEGICSQTGIFDYVNGHYYTGNLESNRITRTEEMGCIFEKFHKNSWNLRRAILSPQRLTLSSGLSEILNQFLGDHIAKNHLHLETRYHPTILRYLITRVNNYTQCIRVIFEPLENTHDDSFERFKVSVEQLKSLSEALHSVAIFISLMPNKTYCCGLIWDKKLLLINPLGIDYQDEFFKMLKVLQAKLTIWVGLSQTPLQYPGYDTMPFASSGPITLELVLHMLTSYRRENFENLLEKMTTSAITIERLELPFNALDLSSLVDASPTLKALQNCENSSLYEQTMITLRQAHYEMLQAFALKSSNASENEAIAPAQEVFNTLVTTKNLTEVKKLKPYAQLEQELQIRHEPKPLANEAPLLEERMCALEKEMSEIKNKIKGGEGQITEPQTNDFKTQLQEKNVEIENLKNQLKAQDKKIEEQEGKIEKLKETVEQLVDDIKRLKAGQILQPRNGAGNVQLVNQAGESDYHGPVVSQPSQQVAPNNDHESENQNENEPDETPSCSSSSSSSPKQS